MNGKLQALGASSYLMSMSTMRNPKLLQWVTKQHFLRLSVVFSGLSVLGSLLSSKVIMCNRQQGFEVVLVMMWLSNSYFILETLLCVVWL